MLRPFYVLSQSSPCRDLNFSDLVPIWFTFNKVKDFGCFTRLPGDHNIYSTPLHFTSPDWLLKGATSYFSCLSIADTSPQVYGTDSVRKQLSRYPGKPHTTLGSLPLRFRLQRPLFQDCVGEGCSDPMGNGNCFSETNTITVWMSRLIKLRLHLVFCGTSDPPVGVLNWRPSPEAKHPNSVYKREKNRSLKHVGLGMKLRFWI